MAGRAQASRENGKKGGRPKGRKSARTLAKAAARERVCQRVYAELDALVQAQIAQALGVSHFFLRNTRGQFEQVTDPKVIEAALNAGDEGRYYWIFTKDPSIQAFTDLMNRALDKPKEQELEVSVRGEVELVQRLAAARLRGKT
jgi:hypothetical protein